MEWILLFVGAVLGILATEAWKWLSLRRDRVKLERRYQQLNREAKSIETMHSSLVLIQAGWDPDGFFRPGSIMVRLTGTYQTPQVIAGIREAHAATWLESGHTNGRQVGLSSFLIKRVSDDPVEE